MSFSSMPTLPQIFLSQKDPAAVLEYGYDAIADITAPDGTVDPIVSASLAVSPSGEVVPSQLLVTGTVISFWLSGGVSGRSYIYQLEFSTAGQATYAFLLGQVCDPTLALSPVPPSANPGFSAPITWP